MSDPSEVTGPPAAAEEPDMTAQGILMCLPEPAKPWFVSQLMNAGFEDIAKDVHSDESNEWFGRHYVGMMVMIKELTMILQKIGVKTQIGGPKPDPHGVVAPQPKKLILP